MYHKANLNRIMADYTSQPLTKIEEDTDRDRYMSPLEAKEYGIIDHIIGGEEAVFDIKGSLKKFPKASSKRSGDGVRLMWCVPGVPGYGRPGYGVRGDGMRRYGSIWNAGYGSI
jgi:hypothetical protein